MICNDENEEQLENAKPERTQSTTKRNSAAKEMYKKLKVDKHVDPNETVTEHSMVII